MTSPRVRRLIHSMAAAGLATAGSATTIACTDPAEPEPTPPVTPTAEQRISDDLARLEQLEILELGELSAVRTEHAWTPYGDTWISTEVALTPDEQADRLHGLVEVAEASVGSVGADAIGNDFWDENGAPSLCTRIEDNAFCLDRELHAANIRRLDRLEIVEVLDIVRSAPAMTGFCYSSWDTVREADCIRALEASALVDATRDLPSADPPEGEP